MSVTLLLRMVPFWSEMTYNMGAFPVLNIQFKDHCVNSRFLQASLEGDPHNPEIALIYLSLSTWLPESLFIQRTFS